MRRVVSVWFPTLPTDRIRRQNENPPETAPLVTVARDGNSRVLAAVDGVAHSLGLQAGMKLAQAQALVPGLIVHDADPDTDAVALARLAGWCLRYAPLAAANPPDGLWIDITGSTHLHGDEAELLFDLMGRLTRHGLGARAAVADTPALAHAMARFGADPVIVVPPGTVAPADLPIEALRLAPETAASLRLMGFDQIGALLATARAPLVRRFGADLVAKLDQLSGKIFEPIVPVVPPERIQARQGFIEPLSTPEAFSTAISCLTALVCTDMERAGRGALHLDLLFERVDGSVQAIRIGSVRPNRDARHLAHMLDERLEQVDPGLGVEGMRLVVAADDRLSFTQASASLADAQASQPDIAPLVDRLVNRLGETRVYCTELVESDVPERSVRKMPPLGSPPGSRRGSLNQGQAWQGHGWQGGGWPVDLPRPVRLLDPPQPVEAMALLPDHPPIAFTWRRVRHRVQRADGPERIAGEWWKRDGEMHSVRDYFRVEDEEGRRFWLFRRGNGSDAETGDMRWFLHGFF